MVSDFKKKKLLYVFNTFFDLDCNGTIDKKDLSLALDKASTALGWSKSGEKYKVIADYLDKMWIGLQSRADRDNDGVVSKEEWITMWDEFSKNSRGDAGWPDLYCKMVFTAVDGNSDGFINSEELANAYGAFGADKDETIQAFHKMSKGKPSIGWDKFQELFIEYYVTDDIKADGNYVAGKTSF